MFLNLNLTTNNGLQKVLPVKMTNELIHLDGNSLLVTAVGIIFERYVILNFIISVVMRGGYQVNSLSCIGVLPFIEGSLGDGTSGLVAVSRDSEEHA